MHVCTGCGETLNSYGKLRFQVRVDSVSWDFLKCFASRRKSETDFHCRNRFSYTIMQISVLN